MAGVAVACRVAVHIVGLSDIEQMSVRSFTVVACPKKNNKNIDFLMSGLDPRTIDGGEEGPRFFFFVTLTVHACEFHNLDLCRGYD